MKFSVTALMVLKWTDVIFSIILIWRDFSEIYLLLCRNHCFAFCWLFYTIRVLWRAGFVVVFAYIFLVECLTKYSGYARTWFFKNLQSVSFFVVCVLHVWVWISLLIYIPISLVLYQKYSCLHIAFYIYDQPSQSFFRRENIGCTHKIEMYRISF